MRHGFLQGRRVDLEVAAEDRRHLEATGYFLCLRCRVPCDVEKQGEYDQHCAHCKSRQVQWVPPKPSTVREFKPRIVPWEPPPEEELAGTPPKLKVSLSAMAFKGFWTCLGCGHITEPLRIREIPPIEVCKLCKSPDIKWNKPELAAITDTLME